jgi:ATP-binding protein involved in chromosome partitioning
LEEIVGRSESEIRLAVGAVSDPDLRRGLEELAMIGDVSVSRREVVVELLLPVEGWPPAVDLAEEVKKAVLDSQGGEGEAKKTRVAVRTMNDSERAELLRRLAAPPGGEPPTLTQAQRPAQPQRHGGAPGPLGHEDGRPNRFMIPGSHTRVIGISSGKGGVGKSSVTVNLAIALAARGREVGVLDADVYGFSIPAMIGADRDPVPIGDLLVPPVSNGVRVLSMGFFVPEDQPVIWRGPMLHKALEQFLVDAYWGEPDFLLIDMPPGTGDVTLSLGQYLTKTEVVVVTTPQPAAQRVAQRSAHAARKLKLSVRGVIENMSWFTGDDGVRYELFGRGGGARLAADLGVPLLAQVPLVPSLREGADVGVPITVSEPEGEAARIFAELATTIAGLGPARVYRRELTIR